MRVLGCSGSLDGGGSERQLWQLLTQLEPPQFESHLYLHYRRGVYLDRIPTRIPVTSFWEDISEKTRFWPGGIHRRQVAHLKQTLADAQIDLVYDRTFHMTLVTAPACRSAGVPRVSVIVSPPSRDFASSPEHFHWLKRRLLRRAYADPRAVAVAVSNTVANDAAEYYRLDREAIRVIPSPVDIEGIRLSSQQASPGIPAAASEPGSLPAPKIHSTATPFRVLVVGRLSAEKGQQEALRAVSLAREQGYNIELQLVGDGPDRPKLEALARQLHLESSVFFSGYLENPYPQLRSADLLCIPSEYEGLANVALEAMVFGTPILSTDAGGSMRELLGENTRGVCVSVANPRTLADGIIDCLEDPASGTQRAKLAQQYVEQYHALPTWLETMRELFGEIFQRDR